MISSSQIRAAKALLRWSGENLANKAGVSLSTIRRVEASEGVPDTQNMKTLLSIMKALEEAGIEFIGAPDDRPGVRLK
jgi:ribosome-binding protein aMBF1 (putative translation factor)